MIKFKELMKTIQLKWKGLSRSKKIQASAAAVVTLVLVIGLPVFAWFTSERKTATVIKINAPTTIKIGAGNEEPVEMIDLSNINVEEYLDEESKTLKTEGTYVFCVTGKYLSKYDLQIARTTNIDFDYELYRVDSKTYEDVISKGITEKPTIGSGYEIAEYKSELDGNTYYYPYQTSNSTDKTQGNITNNGAFLNFKSNGSHTIGNGEENIGGGTTFHTHNYSSYDKVNEYAEPLYWQATGLPVTGKVGDVGFIDYYVLKIKWENKNLTNNKETDMLYITARKSVD